MKQIEFAQTLAVFFLFFGVELEDTFRTGIWMMTIFWVTMAVLFIWMTIKKKKT